MSKYITKQRKLLLSFLENHVDSQLSTSQIANELKDDSISVSSVYRNLSDLELEGKVRRYVDVYKRQTVPHLGSYPKILQDTAKIPNIPAFVSIPESSALAGAGATVWALGSQICSGNIPAFAPNPKSIHSPAAYSAPLSGQAVAAL